MQGARGGGSAYVLAGRGHGGLGATVLDVVLDAVEEELLAQEGEEIARHWSGEPGLEEQQVEVLLVVDLLAVGCGRVVDANG